MKKISMNNNNNTTTSATTGFNPVIISDDMAIVSTNNPCNIGRYVRNNEGILIFLSTSDVERVRKLIKATSNPYKMTVQVISVLLEMNGVDKHIRHKAERRLIAGLGGHTHTQGIRRHFICG